MRSSSATFANRTDVGYVVTSWNGLSAPAGTSPDIINFLNRHINEVLQLAEVQARARQLGVEAAGRRQRKWQSASGSTSKNGRT